MRFIFLKSIIAILCLIWFRPTTKLNVCESYKIQLCDPCDEEPEETCEPERVECQEVEEECPEEVYYDYCADYPDSDDCECVKQCSPCCNRSALAECAAKKVVECVGQKDPECPAHKDPECPAYKDPECPAYKDPDCPAYKVPDCPARKVPDCPAYKLPECAKQKVVECAATEETNLCPADEQESCICAPPKCKPTGPYWKYIYCPNMPFKKKCFRKKTCSSSTA